MTKVIIIGGGFGGINVAKALKNADIELLLIDKTNHHLFQPLLYQVATAALSVSNISSPLREILKNQSNATVLMANVEKINVDTQHVSTSTGDAYSYDYLVIAPGTRHSYFGHDHWEAYAPGLKTVNDAIRIREHMLLAFEKAEACDDPLQAAQYLDFVIIGAGPTGVEMAGSIAEFSHKTLFNNFRRIKPADSKIYLIEGAGQVLPSYPASLAAKAQKDLEKLGVTVLLNSIVTEVNPNGVQIKDRFIPTKNIVWAAGNQASPLLKTLAVPLDRQGRVVVNPDLSIPGHSNVFVIGDAACFMDKHGQSLPGIAPVAIQQARYVSKLINKSVPADKRKPFSYFDKGMISTIGRGKAVGVLRKVKFSGFLAWLVWCVVHIFYLVSFKHRFFVSMHWLALYIANQRQARIILHSIKK
jgi:NADH dehydrogenase